MVHFSERSTVTANCSTETQIEMRDGTNTSQGGLRSGLDVSHRHAVLGDDQVLPEVSAQDQLPGGNCIKLGLPGK